MKKYANILSDLERHIEFLEFDNSTSIIFKAEKIIEKAKESLKKARKIVLSQGFDNKESEIYFFKIIKPKLYSKLIYHLKLFDIENKRPRGSTKSQIKYFNSQINKLQTYLNDNLDFYTYYRRESSIFDEYYFLRGNATIKLFPGTFHFLTDEQFSTSHDSMVAQIMAYDLLIIYIKREIDRLENNGSLRESRMMWTNNKIDLIELIYALYSPNCVNKGRADIKDIAYAAERIFKVDLGDYYRAFLEIRMRKKGRTKFLDALKENLEKRMDEIDE